MHFPCMKISGLRTPTVHNAKKFHPFKTYSVSKSETTSRCFHSFNLFTTKSVKMTLALHTG